MERWVGRVIVLLLLIGFGMFYGIDLATSGIARINGPLEPVADPPASAQQIETTQTLDIPELPEHPPQEAMRAQTLDPAQAGWADGVGKGLQQVFQALVEGIVGLLDKLFGTN